MISVAVLGPGGVGGLVAAALARAGTPTTVIAREDTAQRLIRDGLRVESVRLGTFVSHPRAATALREPVDVLVVATKATTLADALERVEVAPALVVPLLNGIEHVASLRARFGEDRVCAGSIRVESDRPEAATVRHTSPFLRVELAPPWPAVEACCHALRAAEIPTELLVREADVLWSKLVRLNALACTTAASGLALGEIRAHPRWRLALEGAVDETAAVARAEGAAVDPDATLRELAAAHASLTSSMARDVAAGREPELDAIAGAVLRAAARHGLACPTVERLAAAIRRRMT